ncbi:hypothetical protein MHYP_G00315550 [Metynnis hypsauchen]
MRAEIIPARLRSAEWQLPLQHRLTRSRAAPLSSSTERVRARRSANQTHRWASPLNEINTTELRGGIKTSVDQTTVPESAESIAHSPRSRVSGWTTVAMSASAAVTKLLQPYCPA